MSSSSRWLTIVALALVATAARAEFHTFQIEQLYSNADGSVQFVVLHESQGMNGENFLGGQALTSTRMGITKTYLFPNDLPGGDCDTYYGCSPSPTARRRVLIGTAGFAALNLVTPNYVIPNGFLPTDGGTVLSVIRPPASPARGPRSTSHAPRPLPTRPTPPPFGGVQPGPSVHRAVPPVRPLGAAPPHAHGPRSRARGRSPPGGPRP